MKFSVRQVHVLITFYNLKKVYVIMIRYAANETQCTVNRTLLFFLFSNTMLAIGALIYIRLVRIANNEDMYQTAS